MNIWLKRSLYVIVGAVAGFAYYYFVGCTTGACPITSNPYISTGYGALIGAVAGMGKKEQQDSSSS